MHDPKAKSDKEYLLEPARTMDEYPVQSMCCLLRPTAGRVTVRLVNAGTMEEVIKQGKENGIAFHGFQTAINPKHQAARSSVEEYQVDRQLDSGRLQEVKDLVNEYSEIFWKEGDQLPAVQIPVQYEIHLKPEATPQWARPRHLAPDVRKEVNEKVACLLNQGLIRESTSP